jgi:hypothetical protein
MLEVTIVELETRLEMSAAAGGPSSDFGPVYIPGV